MGLRFAYFAAISLVTHAVAVGLMAREGGARLVYNEAPRQWIEMAVGDPSHGARRHNIDPTVPARSLTAPAAPTKSGSQRLSLHTAPAAADQAPRGNASNRGQARATRPETHHPLERGAPELAPPVIPEPTRGAKGRIDFARISPAAAARAAWHDAADMDTSKNAAPAQSGPASSRGAWAFGPRDSGDLDGYLQTRAEHKPHLRRRELRLEKGPGGSLVYRGTGVVANIAADGRVRFEDGRRLKAHKGSLGKFRFDLNDLAARAAGEDPHLGEKRWFLRRTATLRERLARQNESTRLARVRARLRGYLARIWNDPTLSLAERHRRLFAIWDDCDPNSVGEATRSTVETFIRRYLPMGSEDAFTPRELLAFNRERSSSRSFSPYR